MIVMELPTTIADEFAVSRLYPAKRAEPPSEIIDEMMKHGDVKAYTEFHKGD